ncbi:hypothetical protein [Lacinutrix sp. Hel_I_90]|uniref:hypothetical protein n=1 Tax=Lacinutrix sp. Hel_I_90 TaxID=1249999 RepID=UPI0005C98900|nr:hypothetical protein [Lacinutrix sp. Hel_I_90]
MKPSESLKNILIEESKSLKKLFDYPSYLAIHNLVRRMDVVIPFTSRNSKSQQEDYSEFRAFFDYGWLPLIKHYYSKINLKDNLPFTLMTQELITLCDTSISYSGKIEFCKQLLNYEKADLIKINRENENSFSFTFLHENTGIEQFDNKSFNFYKNRIVEKVIELKKKEKPFDENLIKEKVKNIVSSPDGNMIVYHTTEEIDDFYNQQGHFHMLRTQGYDEFDTKDSFGGIEYWRYIDLIELFMGTALMRVDACLELKKEVKTIDLHNTLSYTYYKDKIVQMYSNYLDLTSEVIEQIMSCLSLTKDNYEYYLDYPSAPPPMFFQVADNLLITSIAGCLTNPIILLNKELKRKYKKDYDKAVNNRENRFRNELFMFFQDKSIIKVSRGVNISFKGIHTDIDAIAFDTKTKTLGLFQLKWQDRYQHSMKERFSRISNLFEKANEWIGKIKYWVENNSDKSIISSLQINKQYKASDGINEVYIFVISRNQMNFTGVELDDTVAWSSWHQLIESQADIGSNMDNPIKEMFIKIKALEPKNRLKRDKLPDKVNLEVELRNYKIYNK